jgi:hypothetical protein
MADLLDIATATAAEVVKINGERIVVRGLQANAIASIAARFPNIGTLLAGGDNMVPRLIAQAGEAVGPIIAAGCGHPGDENYELHCSTNLLVEHQMALLKAIIGLTFPNGFRPFVDLMAELMQGPVDEVQKPVRVRLKKSPSPSQPSSGAASRPIMQ